MLIGAFCQSSFRWIYYYDDDKFTGKETNKSHLCAVYLRSSIGPMYGLECLKDLNTRLTV